MASELERARQDILEAADRGGAVERVDAKLEQLEEAVRRSERVAVVARIQAREWGLFVHSSTVDRITDFILEGDHDQ